MQEAFFTKKVSLDEFKAMYPKEDDMLDRIKQMAEEAGFRLEPGMDAGYIEFDELARFAQLVAEDCAKEVAPSSDHRSNPNDYIAGEDGIELLDAVVEKIRARYGIKE